MSYDLVLGTGQTKKPAAKSLVLAHCVVRGIKPQSWEEISTTPSATDLFCPECGYGLPCDTSQYRGH